jgi:hypothetical protein
VITAVARRTHLTLGAGCGRASPDDKFDEYHYSSFT